MNPLNLSHAANLAIHALAILKTQPRDRRMSVTELSRLLDVSKSHLAKVMQKIARAGLVDSSTGSKGGFILTCDPEKVTLYDISSLIDGEIHTESCLFDGSRCQDGGCVIAAFQTDIVTKIKSKLEGTTLAAFNVLILPEGEEPPEKGLH